MCRCGVYSSVSCVPVAVAEWSAYIEPWDVWWWRASGWAQEVLMLLILVFGTRLIIPSVLDAFQCAEQANRR